MSIMRSICIFTALFCLIVGCAPAPESGRAFRLPDGNSIAGKQVFLRLQCHACHKITGVDLPPINLEPPVTVTLGGPTARVKTYGELVTSIINPSHVLSEEYRQELEEAKLSPMPEFNHVMTVNQMIDLVAFLQPRYKLVEPAYAPTHYP